MQWTHHVVQSGQLLAFGCLADDDRAVEQIGVVGMDGLAGLQHHVVGDVDRHRDGAHPCELDAAGEPARTGSTRIDPGDGEQQTAGKLSDCSSTG